MNNNEINMKIVFDKETLKSIIQEQINNKILTDNQKELIFKKFDLSKESFKMALDCLESEENKSDIKTCFIVYNTKVDKYFYISCKEYIEDAKPKYLNYLKDLQNRK